MESIAALATVASRVSLHAGWCSGPHCGMNACVGTVFVRHPWPAGIASVVSCFLLSVV